MYNKIVLMLALYSISCMLQGAVLQEILPIKNVWSIFTRGDKAVLRFKGNADESQLVQYSNVGRAEIRETNTWNVIRAFEPLLKSGYNRRCGCSIFVFRKILCYGNNC